VAGVEDVAVSDDVVSDDDGAGTGELDRPFEVVCVVLFVGVEEDEVEWGDLLGVQASEGFECGSYALVNEGGQAGSFDVGCSYAGVGGVELQRDEFAVRWKGASEPDGAVSAECADFEDASGPLNAREQMKEFALVGRDVDCGEIGFGVCLHGVVEGGVWVNEGVGEVVVDGGPEIFVHGWHSWNDIERICSSVRLRVL